MIMPRVIPTIVEQHVTDAAFLWLLRDQAVRAPHYDRKDLAKLDQRVEAHLDGLRVAGDDGWTLALAQLNATPEPGEVFVCAALALAAGKSDRIDAVVDVAEATPNTTRAFISAVGWLSASIAAERLTRFHTAPTAVRRRIGIAGMAIHRRDPGAALERALFDPDPLLKARALRAVSELGQPKWLSVAREAYHADHPEIRFAALAAGARLARDPAAIELLQTWAMGEETHRVEAVQLASRCLEFRTVDRWLRTLKQLSGGARLALIGYGAHGDPAGMPFILEALSDPALTRIAGEAFTFITGADLALEDLERKPPAQDPEADLDHDENLPWPDPHRIASWWSHAGSKFSAGTRYLCGRTLTNENLVSILASGKQRQRMAAALELALHDPRQPLFEVRAPGWRQ